MQKQVLKTTAYFSLFVFLAQVLGLARDLYLVKIFGVGEVLDAYYFAFKIPDFLNTFYSVFLGAVVLIPLLTKAKYLNGENNTKEVVKVLQEVISLVFSLLAFFSLLFLVFTPSIVNVLVPGWAEGQKALLVDLSRILILAQMFFPLGIAAGSLGMVYHRNFGVAVSALVYNLVILLGAIFLTPIFGIYGVAWGVVAGALCFMLAQVWPKEVWQILRQTTFVVSVKEWVEFVKSNFLRFVSVFSYQLYGVMLLYFAAQAGVGGATTFSLAYNIFLAIFYVVSGPFSGLLMPHFSENFVKTEPVALKNQLVWSAKILVLVSAGISLSMFYFSWLVVEVLFFFSNLSVAEKNSISVLLSILILSFVFMSAVELFRKYFYSTNQIGLSAFVSAVLYFSVPIFLFLLKAGVLADGLILLAYAIVAGTFLASTTAFLILKFKKEI